MTWLLTPQLLFDGLALRQMQRAHTRHPPQYMTHTARALLCLSDFSQTSESVVGVHIK